MVTSRQPHLLRTLDGARVIYPESVLSVKKMECEMEIRKAGVADADRITYLLTQLGYPGTEGYLRDKIVRMESHPDAELAVAVEDGVIAGLISIHFIPQIALPGSFARISYLVVDEEFQGRGVGTGLESYCLRLARERGCDRIEVHCHSRRKRAHDFYHRQGYEESPKYLIKKLK
jgi:GNAT superfamily N-acetyltransferase